MKKLDIKIKKCCENCGKNLILKNNRDIIKKRFCSRKCSSYFTTTERQKKDPTLLIKFRLAGLTEESNKKKGIKFNFKPTYKIHKCQICNNTFKIPLSRHNKGYGKCCSKKCYKLYNDVPRIKTNCLNCGKDIWDTPKKNRKYCSCSCRMIHLLPKQKFKGTDIELKLKHFLVEKNIQFEYQPRIKDIVNADFLIKPNIVIFADGDYWHGLPNAIQRDNIVNKKLSENNYVVLRFKGTQINKDFDSVQNKIMSISMPSISNKQQRFFQDVKRAKHDPEYGDSRLHKVANSMTDKDIDDFAKHVTELKVKKAILAVIKDCVETTSLDEFYYPDEDKESDKNVITKEFNVEGKFEEYVKRFLGQRLSEKELEAVNTFQDKKPKKIESNSIRYEFTDKFRNGSTVVLKKLREGAEFVYVAFIKQSKPQTPSDQQQKQPGGDMGGGLGGGLGGPPMMETDQPTLDLSVIKQRIRDILIGNMKVPTDPVFKPHQSDQNKFWLWFRNPDDSKKAIELLKKIAIVNGQDPQGWILFVLNNSTISEDLGSIDQPRPSNDMSIPTNPDFGSGFVPENNKKHE